MDIVAQLVAVDWAAACARTHFCLSCSAAFCRHCCNHGATHHPNPRWPSPLMVREAYNTPAVLAEDTQGWGYHTSGIQRLIWKGEKIILIHPQDHVDGRHGAHCRTCNRAAKRGSLYCSLPCRLIRVPGGKRQEMARALSNAALDFGHHVHLMDRFCLFCSRAFCSNSCPDHVQHHPTLPQADQYVLVIHHLNRWPAVEAVHLPANSIQHVQSFLLDDGQVVYPIQGRAPLDAAVEVMDPQGHPCESLQCPETVVGPFPFCSLRCHHIG